MSHDDIATMLLCFGLIAILLGMVGWIEEALIKREKRKIEEKREEGG